MGLDSPKATDVHADLTRNIACYACEQRLAATCNRTPISADLAHWARISVNHRA